MTCLHGQYRSAPCFPRLAVDGQSIPASAKGQVELNTPSGNIGCIYAPNGGTNTCQPRDGGPEHHGFLLSKANATAK